MMKAATILLLTLQFVSITSKCIQTNGSECEADKLCYRKKFWDENHVAREELGCDHDLTKHFKLPEWATQKCYRVGADLYCVCADRPQYSCNTAFSGRRRSIEYASTEATSGLVVTFVSLLIFSYLIIAFFKTSRSWPIEKAPSEWLHYLSILVEIIIFKSALYALLHFKLTVFACYPLATNFTDVVPKFYRMPTRNKSAAFSLATFFVTGSFSLFKVFVLVSGKNHLMRKDMFIWSVFAKLVCLVLMVFAHRNMFLQTYHDVTVRYGCEFKADLLEFAALCNQITLITLCGSFFLDLLYYISPSFEKTTVKPVNDVYESTLEKPLVEKVEAEVHVDVVKIDQDYRLTLTNVCDRTVHGTVQHRNLKSDPEFVLEPRQTCFVTVAGPAGEKVAVEFGFASESGTFQRLVVVMLLKLVVLTLMPAVALGLFFNLGGVGGGCGCCSQPACSPAASCGCGGGSSYGSYGGASSYGGSSYGYSAPSYSSYGSYSQPSYQSQSSYVGPAPAPSSYVQQPVGKYVSGPSYVQSGSYQAAPAGGYQAAPAGGYQAAPSGGYQAAPAGGYQAAPVASYQASYQSPAKSYQAAPAPVAASFSGSQASYSAAKSSYIAQEAPQYSPVGAQVQPAALSDEEPPYRNVVATAASGGRLDEIPGDEEAKEVSQNTTLSVAPEPNAAVDISLLTLTNDTECNSDDLRQIVKNNISEDLNSSKRLIQLAAEAKFGGRFDVICSASDFSYVTNTELFCQETQEKVSCYAYRQL
ncbi:unnamed protein product [Bursaphelenchus okinawaensis]|uniref:Ground-like domain-containing protein n=1 Tax=Bursaphelenchus okinawaensis TaxID=465554 RepID=A0A811L9F3_9BILA|nr:unnamed protein product [Bursaphelenchus okinawaensis]CAG9119773.1 unnamed protein product [Bursaphelenchus okinawaensis]